MDEIWSPFYYSQGQQYFKLHSSRFSPLNRPKFIHKNLPSQFFVLAQRKPPRTHVGVPRYKTRRRFSISSAGGATFSSIFHIYHHLRNDFPRNIHLCNPGQQLQCYILCICVVAVSFCNCCCGILHNKNPAGDGSWTDFKGKCRFLHKTTQFYFTPLITAIIRLQFTNAQVKLFCIMNIFQIIF